jgi:RNA polymerase sigma-B factor
VSATPGRAESAADPGDAPVEDPSLREFRASGDQALRSDIVARYDWVAQHAARRFRDRGEPFDDLLQVARLGVLKALERFDPDAGSGFPAYAMATAVGELRRHFRDTTWKVHVPRRAKELQTRMRAAIESLSQELGRAPTPSELAARLEVDEDVVLAALDASTANRTSSLDDHDRAGQGSSAVFASGERPIDDLVAVRDLLDRLPERERTILQMRFYNGMSQEEIAQKVGVSQVHVSRLLRSTLLELRRSLTEE